MPFPEYFIGSGDVKIAPIDTDGNPGAFRDCGEVTVAELEPAVDFADNFATGKLNANLQDLHVPVKKQLSITLTFKERTAKNLEQAFHGEHTTEATGTFSTPTAFPDDVEVGHTSLLPGRHVGISSLVIIDSAGSPSTLVDGQHYRLNADAGMVDWLDIDAADPVAAEGNIHFASQPNADDTTVVGGKTYTWKVSPTLATHIEIGDDIETSATNLAAKINADTASTLCTADPGPADVALTANTPGVGGNTITLTVDGARLTKTAFADGDDADAFVQPFICFSYAYSENEVVTLLSQNPPEVCVLLDLQNLAVAGERARAIVDRVQFAPASKISLKSGSASGTATEADTFELRGVAMVIPGHSDYGDYRAY